MLIDKFFLISLSLILVTPNVSAKDSLGRLFTTPEQRKQLDLERNKAPITVEAQKKPEIIEIVEVEEPEEVIEYDAIQLKGLVYRSDGKNTAWINDGNTYEGDTELSYIKIPNEKITSDEVSIVMPDEQTEVKIKVGDYFDPANKNGN